MYSYAQVDGTPKQNESKLHKALTHTGSVIGIITGVLAIVGFFGIQPHLGGAKPAKKTEGPIDKPKIKITEPGPSLRRRGVGTFRFEGGFPPGEPMLAKEDLQPQGRTFVTVQLTRPSNSRDESLLNTLVLAAVPRGHLSGIWREGTRLLHGVKLSSDHFHVSGSGIDADVPVDSDGKLATNVLWPAKQMFLQVTFPGPVTIGNVTLANGLTFGDEGADEPGNTLPTHFELELPRPGEVLSAFRGEAAFPGTWDGDRFAVVQALSPSGDPSASWSATLKQASATPIRTVKDGVLNEGLSGVKLLYSRSGS